MLSILIVIIGISILILVHELGHFLAAKFFGVGVEEFGIGFPPRIFSKKIGETRYSINALPLGGFVRLKGEFQSSDDEIASSASGGLAMTRKFTEKKPWQRAIVMVAGVFMNFIFGWLLLSMILFVGAPQYILVNGILPNSVAMEVGIMKGDRVLGFSSVSDLTNFIKNNSGKEIGLKILRRTTDGQIKQLEIKATSQGTLGVMISDVGMPAQPLLSAIGKGFLNSVIVIWSILVSLGSVFSAPQSFVGPIGIFNVALETGKLGVIYIFQLLALISLNLVVLNLLPVPALDGGRLFFLLIEKIKGSAISQKREIFWNTAGFVFLILLIITITVFDVIRIL